MTKLAGGCSPKIHGLKKLACAKARGAAGSHGDVEFDADMIGMRRKTAWNVRLVKGRYGCEVMEENR